MSDVSEIVSQSIGAVVVGSGV